VRRVRQVGNRIRRAVANEDLQREINLDLKNYRFEWEFNVIDDRQVNAFCLPGGKIAVFSGLLRIVDNDDQLATVMGHEVAHALAHHASERIARAQMQRRALEAASGAFGQMSPEERAKLTGLLAGGARLRELAYDRAQEAEADHIGLFLMTFAGYDPRQTVVFWEKMEQMSGRSPPEILSTHPSHHKRIQMLERWIPQALGALEQYRKGNIAPRQRERAGGG
jgi:predicted Zn-dependent protease